MASDYERQDALYSQAIAEFGDALSRLARAYESDSDRRSDLLQDIHLEIWRSFAGFQQQCSLRTWVYRVAHNVGISKRLRPRKVHLVSLQEIAEISAGTEESAVEEAHDLARLLELVRQLVPPDNQVMLLYLEDMDAASIGEITGLSSRAVAMRIHRIKAILARQLRISP